MRLKTLPAKPVLERVTLRLTHPATPGEAGQWRRRAGQALERLTLNPSLPPQAILIVRRLADPQPGALLADRAGPQRRAWARAAQARLATCWRQAARPARETVPPSAEAVWFADAAEWLACLSWDLDQGLAAGRWWWQRWLCGERVSSVAGALVQIWTEAAPYLPPSLALLHQQHGAQLEGLLARFSPEQAAGLRRAVLAAYRLPPDLPAQTVIEQLHPLLPDAAYRLVYALPPETRSLASLCLAVSEAPLAVTRLRQPPATAPVDSLPARTEAGLEQPAVEAVREKARSRTKPDPGPALLAGQSHPADAVAFDETPAPRRASPPGPIKPETTSPAAPAEPASAGPKSAPPAASSAPAGPEKLNGIGRRSLAQAPARPSEPPSDSAALAAETGLLTAVGGLWYLVNVLNALDWVEDNDLNGWHRLAFLAQALLPEPLPDPVWALLAELAGEPVAAEAADRWLARTLPLVTAYLTERLAQPATLAAAIRDPATLFLTRTHVDVVFALDQIRLDLRQAGLDRDPGWTPVLGRVVAFHYE